jgi:hypothetical protein
MKHRSSLRSLSLFAVASAFALSAGNAVADGGFSTTIGPIPLTPAPLKFCNGDTCVKTPALGSVSLTAAVVPDHLFGLAPSVSPVPCGPGRSGLALMVTTHTSDASVTALVQGSANGTLFNRSIGPVRVTANRGIVVSACTF